MTAGTPAAAREAFLILCVQVAGLHIGQSLVVPILPLYAATFGVSVTLVGLLLSMQSLPRMFANLPAGRWADKVGAHRLLAIACATVAVSALGAALAPNYGVLLASRILQGIGTAISATAGLTFTANISSADNRARHISLFQGSFLLGNGIGPIIGGFSAELMGYRAPFFAYAVIAILIGVWIVLRLPDSRQWSNSTESTSEQPPVAPPSKIPVRSMLLMGGVLFACFVGFISSLTRSATRNFGMVLVAEDMGASEGQIGLSLSVIFAVNVAVLYVAGALGDRYDPRLLMLGAWSITGVALVGMSTVTQFGWLLGAAAAYGLASGIESPVPAVHISRTVGEASQGTALGLYRSFNDLGLVVGPFLLGWIARVWSPSLGVMLNGLLCLAAALGIGFVLMRRRLTHQPAL